MLKISPEEIAKPLLIIFNKSLQQSKYPSNWKSAHFIAIFKKGDTSLPSNYRPISLISCVCKLMERKVYKHVYNHLVNNNLIYKYQSGSRIWITSIISFSVICISWIILQCICFWVKLWESNIFVVQFWYWAKIFIQ
jgi:hypothetical protein